MTSSPEKERLPWEIVETVPTSSPELIDRWQRRLDEAASPSERVRAAVGYSLSTYWAAQLEATSRTWAELADERGAMTLEALDVASAQDDPDLRATAILGRLYGCWGPDQMAERSDLIARLTDELDRVTDPELRLRSREWIVLDHFDHGDLESVRVAIASFRAEPAAPSLPLFRRRELLWYANLAMLEGAIDRAVELNQQTISETAGLAGSPLSFQNAAITVAIERYLRRGLADVIETIASIRSSSPRVGANWDTGLAFALAESERLDEAREVFEDLAVEDFMAIPRDLNWLATMQLIALVAIRLEDVSRCERLLEMLTPFVHLDATHGSGYASYGPVGRVVGSLAAQCGRLDEARDHFDQVLTTRAPGPWTSLTRLDYARSHAREQPGRAFELARQSEGELRSFHLTSWAEMARALWIDAAVEGHGPPIASLQRGRWTLRHRTGSAHLDAGVGEAHLVELLARPGELLAAAEIDGPGSAEAAPTVSGFRLLDHTARRAYMRRLDHLKTSEEPEAEVERERSFLRRELAAGAFVPSSSAEDERARVRVTKALRRTIERVSEQSGALGAHLATSVTTGAQCRYAPSDGARWLVVREPEPGDRREPD